MTNSKDSFAEYLSPFGICILQLRICEPQASEPGPMNAISEIAYEKTDSDTIHFISLPLRESPKQSRFTLAHLA